MVPDDSYVTNDGNAESDVNMSNCSDRETKNDLIDLNSTTDEFRLQDDDEELQEAEVSIEPLQHLPINPTLFKTTDRLMNDLVNDLSMFDIGWETGILKSPTLEYARRLSAFLQSNNNDSVYKLGIINNKISFAPSQERLDNGVSIIRGFIFKKRLIANPFETTLTPLYNVKIVIKQDNADSTSFNSSKNGFYSISDDELTPKNKEALITDYSKIYEESKSKYSNEQIIAIEKAIPNIIDYGTFISLNSSFLIRIELSTGFFDSNALQNFEEGKIQERLSNFLTSDLATPIEQPTVSQCFSSITRILKGPLTHEETTDIKSIRSDHKILNVHAGLDFMLEYLSFTFNAEAGELFPPDLKLPLLRESFIVKYLEALFFSRSPLITLGDESIVSHMLNERVEFGVASADSEEKRQDCLSSYIALSSRYRYSDTEIKDLYTLFVKIDPENSLKYFDFLEDVSSQRNTLNLKAFAARLRNEGKMGYSELCKCYQTLEIPPENYESVDELQLLQQYSALLVVTETSAAKERLRDALLKIAKLKRSQNLINHLNSEPFFDVSAAFDMLEVNETVDNDLIITALEVKKSDIPGEANLFDRALLTIAIHRTSFVLLEYIEKNLAYLNNCLEIDFSRAYEYLGVDKLASDFQVVTISQERLAKDSTIDVRILRLYLRYIGKQKKSKLINEFLKKGIIEPLFLPIENSPVGLNNIGNTCYLNSLLQYYFVIEPLRSLILNFNELIDEEKFNSNAMFSKRRIGNRTVGFKETERSYQFVYQLRDLFEELIKSKVRCISPKKELAYLSFSPSTDEVIFQIEQDKPDYSDMQLIHVETPKRSDSPILVDSDASSLHHSDNNSAVFLQSDHPEAEWKRETETEDSITADASPMEVLIQSPLKRRLSSESCEVIATNKSANKGHAGEVISDTPMSDSETEEIHTVVEGQAVKEEATLKKNTSATCQISADQMENALEMGRQQDVTECIQNVLYQLESAFSPSHLEGDDEQYDLIKELFYGKTKQTLQPFNSSTTSPSTSDSQGTVRSKVERFLSLLVNIGDHPKDIYDALDTYFTEDVIKMDDGDVKRSLTITDLPKVLQIQIQRVQFDRVKLMPFKSIDPIPFEEKLYMDRYMETDDLEIIRRRKEVFEWKHRISLLNIKKHEMSKKVDNSPYNFKDGLTVFKNYIETNVLDGFEDLKLKPETFEIMDTVLKDINSKEQKIADELKTLQQNIGNQFQDFKKVGYSLFAIFIHRGEASYGHYWIYIKDPKRNFYRKYNDENVTEVPYEEVFNFEEGNTATPYFLVYVKEDLEESVVDPLRRDVGSEEGQTLGSELVGII